MLEYLAMEKEIKPGDFVVILGTKNEVGMVVRARQGDAYVGINHEQPAFEVWFGEVGKNGLPNVRVIPSVRCSPIGNAKHVFPWKKVKKCRRQSCKYAALMGQLYCDKCRLDRERRAKRQSDCNSQFSPCNSPSL